MKTNMNRARWVIATGLIAAGVLGACDRVKTELLQPQNPGLVDPASVLASKAAGALALRVGALGRYTTIVNSNGGESVWAQGGLLTAQLLLIRDPFQVAWRSLSLSACAAIVAWAIVPVLSSASLSPM